jgi:hypothetical protein
LGAGISFGLPYLAPQFLNSLNQLTPVAIGLIMFPAAIASNPVVSNVQVFNFSNIFTVLALIALVTMGLYALQFQRGSRRNTPAVEQG